LWLAGNSSSSRPGQSTGYCGGSYCFSLFLTVFVKYNS
jgi:hypothetical protein